MDRLEDISGIRDPRELKGKNWLWLRPRRLLRSLQVAVWAAPSLSPEGLCGVGEGSFED